MSDGHPFNLPLKVRWRLARRNVEHRLRNRFLDLLRWMFRTSDISSPQLSAFGFPKGVRRLLIVRTGRAIGDMVMSLVLIPECRRLFPDARVECLMRDSLLPFFKEGAGADEVLEFYPRFL